MQQTKRHYLMLTAASRHRQTTQWRRDCHFVLVHESGSCVARSQLHINLLLLFKLWARLVISSEQIIKSVCRKNCCLVTKMFCRCTFLKPSRSFSRPDCLNATMSPVILLWGYKVKVLLRWHLHKEWGSLRQLRLKYLVLVMLYFTQMFNVYFVLSENNYSILQSSIHLSWHRAYLRVTNRGLIH